MSELLRRYADEIPTGIFRDMPARRHPFWDDAQNVIFTNLAVQPIPGQAALFAPADASPVLGILVANIGGEDVIVFGTQTKLYKWTAAAGLTQEGSGYTGGLDDPWTIVSWGTHFVATNGIDQIQADPGSGFANLGGSAPSFAKIISRRTPFMLAFNTDEGQGVLEWCDRDDYTNWLSTPSNFAGNLPIRDLDSPIIAALPFGTETAFLTEGQLHLASFIGAPLVFRTDLLLDTVGAIGRKAVCQAEGMLYGMSSRGFWKSDGNSEAYIDTPQVRNYVQDNLNFAHRHRVVAWHDKFLRQVVFFFPSLTSELNDTGVAYNYQDKNWSRVGFGRTAASNDVVFESGLTGTAQGNILVQNLPGAPQGSLNIGVLDLNLTAQLQIGYGWGGYGNFTYGGTLEVDG